MVVIELIVEIADDLWAEMMEPDEDFTPTPESQLEYFVEYISDAYMDDRVTYGGRIV